MRVAGWGVKQARDRVTGLIQDDALSWPCINTIDQSNQERSACQNTHLTEGLISTAEVRLPHTLRAGQSKGHSILLGRVLLIKTGFLLSR